MLQGHAALYAFVIACDGAPDTVFKVAQGNLVGERGWIDSAHGNGAVAPNRGWAAGREQSHNEHSARYRWQHRKQAPFLAVLSPANKNSSQRQHCQEPGDELPAARCRQERQETKPTRQGSDNGSDGVGGTPATGLATDVGAATTEQGNQHGKLNARGHGRGKDDEAGDEGPAKNVARKTAQVRDGAHEESQKSDAIAQGEGNGHRDCLDEADGGKSPNRCRQPTSRAQRPVHQAASTNTEKRNRQNGSETEYRPAEEWSQHAVPDHLHEKEGEAHHGGCDEDEARRRAGGVRLGGRGIRLVRCDGAGSRS